MACSGLHCGGCAGGMAVPVVPLVAFLGLAWVAEHLIEVAVVSASCGVLAVAAVVALMRWADRRDARLAARGPLMVTRAPAPTLTATVIPQVSRGTVPPAIVNNYYIRIDPASREAARIIRQSLPGMAGDAITEGNDHVQDRRTPLPEQRGTRKGWRQFRQLSRGTARKSPL